MGGWLRVARWDPTPAAGRTARALCGAREHVSPVEIGLESEVVSIYKPGQNLLKAVK